MSTANRRLAAGAGFVRREHDRSAVALPAIIRLSGQEYSARIVNIAPGGAMIECSASFPPAASFFLRCGSIAADAIVVWEKSGRYGVNFRSSLSEEQMLEQLTRHEAINTRKLLKGQSDSPTDRSPTAIAVHQIRDTVGGSALAAHLSAIEISHQQVESCVLLLEAIIAGELSDIGQFSAARLRLRKANLARTQVALAACRHLITTTQAQQILRDLQRSELEVSQTISEHVQSWTLQALQNDWKGYCHATRKILESVRELIAAEKKLLCPLLRGGGQVHRPL